ncbi:MAG: cell surface protein SprA [Flavobacteriaceae bacterium]|nr:cell surface protein SprA [Flavobacteriaceae bacterium]
MRLNSYKRGITLGFILLFSLFIQAQETEVQDSTQTGYNLGRLELPNPPSIAERYEYDPLIDRYVYIESVGDFNINYPVILTPEEYERLILAGSIREYYKQKVDAVEGKKDGSEDLRKNILPEFYVNSGFFESIFGGNTIELIPQGSIEMDLGVLLTKQDNPAFSPQNRRNFSFDFDQRISLSLLGKIGTRMQVTANFDTESTFDFQNLFKLEYTPTEDDILQKIEVGNVSMPLNSSLITGAQSLFGFKTELQFGKTRVTGVFSEQRSQTRTVTAQGGGTVEEFEIFGLDYDEDRHFFLAQYFRDRYDIALANYPFINNGGLQITRIEVWVTNRNNSTDNIRNVVALQDLGESDPTKVGLNDAPSLPGSFYNAAAGAFPDNSNNDLDPGAISAGSILTNSIRDIATVQLGFGVLANEVAEGVDYGTLESARKLQPNEYSYEPDLGYISLNQRLSNDEVLAVAYQFTVGGQVYQVGEFANDGVDATSIDNSSGNDTVTNQALVLKMLKSPITNVDEPIWDLMMKNIYALGAYQLTSEDFRLNILWTDPAPLNYIEPEPGTTLPQDVDLTPLIQVFNLDKLNLNNDPQPEGDGFFDFYPGITVDPQNGNIIFTTVEPFGRHLFDKIEDGTSGAIYENPATYFNNPNVEKYVYDKMYSTTKTAALDDAQKNKFQIRGKYKGSGGDGIPIGAFNVPRGSVKVTAGGRLLIEGIDYTVNYQLGRVQILDPSLQASNIPIEVSVENNAVFGQQNKRFTGINVEHQFNENFLLGATFLNLNERPLTQKSNLGSEPINNSIFGINGNYSTELPFLTRLVNKLPNIDTDAPSNLSVRGEIAVLKPGAPKITELNGEITTYIDDFEGSQTSVDIRSPLSWNLSSAPIGLGGEIANDILAAGFGRAKLNWYSIDPVFYNNQAPGDIDVNDISYLQTRRIAINELFPQQDIVQGQQAVLFPLDMTYYPQERGEYNDATVADFTTTSGLGQTWGGISRQLTSTDFEQSNVEFIEFWLQDPFIANANNDDPNIPGPTNPVGGRLMINLGSISEDVMKDGRKLYENGLQTDRSLEEPVNTTQTNWGKVPTNQSLIYAFDSTGDAERANQDRGLDGLLDDNEALFYQNAAGINPTDPAGDNYRYFLNTDGNILERYRQYNGTQGNSPIEFTDTNRGSTTQPDVEDINRDNTMNTIDSYFEYEIPIEDGMGVGTHPFIKDEFTRNVTLPNNDVQQVHWVQFRVPVTEFATAVNGISDFRSIRFMRMYLTGFTQPVTLRFGTLELVRGDWRRYLQTLDDLDPNPDDDGTTFEVGAVNILENENRTPIPYVLPPGVEREELQNNNTVVRQNEQSLSLRVCDLEQNDSRAVFKNVDVDMRQFKRLRMFLHAEQLPNEPILNDGEMVAFIRLGNDYTNNFYQIEVPLNVTPFGATSATAIWPPENDLNLDLTLLQRAKSLVAATGDPTVLTFFNEQDLGSNDNRLRIGIVGNPNFGRVRTLMVGVKNSGTGDICGEVWFNELRLSDMDSEGGWAALLSADANIADFATISATGRRSTIGFGTLEQSANERSREDLKQYDVVTNINLGQLLPKKWGIQLPFNYGQSETLITPEYDPEFQDIPLQDRLDAITDPAERDRVESQAIDYTKRKSINFIGVRKNRTGEAKPRFYDIENFTFNYSFNQEEHHDFELENFLNQTVQAGATYNHTFEPITLEPLKNVKFLSKSKYFDLLKDFNFNLLPNSIAISSNYNRQFNKQRFREVENLGIGLPELFKRNYLFDWQYTVNYNLTKSLQIQFSASNNNIVRNYFNPDGTASTELGVWDGFFDVGDPNRHSQNLLINYELPISKIPVFGFVKANYQYSGDFQWQKGSDLLASVQLTDDNGVVIVDPITGLPQTANLGNSIQNANKHTLNTSFDMKKLYRYLKFKKKPITKKSKAQAKARPEKGNQPPPPAAANADAKKKKKKKPKNTFGNHAYNVMYDVVTSIKKIQANYTETNGTYVPGYTNDVGFIGTLKPSFGFTFGSQADIRYEAARKGWLTLYDQFNEQYTQTNNKQLSITANIEPLKDLKIDITANRIEAKNYAENFIVENFDTSGLNGQYRSLTPNTYGNFSVSAFLLRTAFSKSDENSSQAFDNFRENRLTVANRLAQENGVDLTNPANIDTEGFPKGFGKTSQRVLLPAFLSAYSGQSGDKVKLGAFRDIPLPNWQIKYTGLMRTKFFKKHFKRFSIIHGYRSNYTINNYNTNLDFVAFDPDLDYDAQNPNVLDQAGNYKSDVLFSNVNLTEQFSPLVKLDFEMKNSIRISTEVKRDRALSLSFDNNLLTEIQGQEYIVGLGYRIKDLKFKTRLGGKSRTIKGDLNMKADLGLRNNKTIIRYLDLDNNQITAGQNIWNIKLTSDYALSQNLTAIFFFDYTFSDAVISTTFPQTTIRSGLTLRYNFGN